jgi:hypothetical protein
MEKPLLQSLIPKTRLIYRLRGKRRPGQGMAA